MNRLIGILVAVACFIGCSPCSNLVIKRIPSPDGKYIAVIFDRNCGATTGFSTQISLITSDSKLLNESGNIFIANTNHGEAPSAEWGGPDAEVFWKNSKLLMIQHHAKAQVFKAEQKYQDIMIEYKKTN